jgi:caspase domain-containing protein
MRFRRQGSSGSLWFLTLVLSLAPLACVRPVLKMPTVLPDIVKEYKSVLIYGTQAGMQDTGVQVKDGDLITLVATGEIVYNRQTGRSQMPPGILMYRFGKEGPYLRWYAEWEMSAAAGNLFLGFPDGPVDSHGEPLKPEYYRDNQGFFVVDIIVWGREDPIAQAEFMEDLSRNNPENVYLRSIADNFKRRKELALAEQAATQQVQESKAALEALRQEEAVPPDAPVPGAPGPPSPAPGAPPLGSPDKEQQLAELTTRLQQALQSLNALEELKRQLATQQAREQDLAARLARLQAEQGQATPPVIAIVTPQEGTIVDRETVSLYGVAEHAAGIARFEIVVNGEVRIGKTQPARQAGATDVRRVEFSEQVRLREGKNDIAVVAYSTEGQSARKTLLVQFLRKPDGVWAVVIGINRYQHLPRLRYAVNDAREFYRYLVEVNRVPREHIWLLLDEEATLDRIRSVLGTQLRRQAEREDTVIIYLAGHGATERDLTSLDGDGLEKYILPHNADPKDLYASALPMNEVSRIFQRIASERLILIADTCYSGAAGGRTIPVVGTRANLSGTFLERLAQGRGRVLLTASDANEVSVEKDEFQHGVFTYYLLEALRGKADFDGDGAITLDEVYRYVSSKVPQATGQDQHPVKKGEMTGQIILGVTGLGDSRQE